jgi:hypothetical protein
MLQSDWHKKDIKHKDGRLIRLCITSKLCLHSNLQALRRLALWLLQLLRFLAAHKRRSRNRPCLSKGCAEVLW